MIVAIGFGNTECDTPSVMIVDTTKCTEAWRLSVTYEIKLATLMASKSYNAADRLTQPPLPDEWESLEEAQVTLPATVEAAVFIYYEG